MVPRAATFALPLVLLTLPGVAWADGPLSTPADIAWVAISAALVFFMQAGFALLEGGTSRAKNSVNVIMKNYADLCVGALAFWAVGFAVMFGTNPSGWIGTTGFFYDPDTGADAMFFVFQAMFAATAATIVSGAVAERMRFFPYALASVVVTGFIYAVFGSWVWGSWIEGQGWLAQLGFIDFAGSTVVHSVGAWCALAGVLVLGPRLGRYGRAGDVRAIPGHNLPMVALGGFILWLGWFGFNGGSTLAASEDVGGVLLNTHLAGAAGWVGATLMQRLLKAPVLMSHSVNGAIAGLVAITAGCASMNTGFAVLTGLIGGMIMVLGSRLLDAWQIDDVVGAVPVHGFAGVWGTIATGLFYADDLFNPERVVIQAVGAFSAFLWAFPVAWVLFYALKKIVGLRADTLHEQRGLDYTEHAEIGYPEFQKELTHGGQR
ncbi:ammonium transporter [Flagellatimonas centrodinii]|uniref:ammonium transporter n=1 Tax=Flagellatimonas centrodinii TaxID=2806210 RepID=UPI001FEEF848|nr:ammonium transporter [Flagellatimonas centrodinii]ULQ47277.1 ammonium transporter [Flagellatimonas centrodinii]